jgi:hypothetical protein
LRCHQRCRARGAVADRLVGHTGTGSSRRRG